MIEQGLECGLIPSASHTLTFLDNLEEQTSLDDPGDVFTTDPEALDETTSVEEVGVCFGRKVRSINQTFGKIWR